MLASILLDAGTGPAYPCSMEHPKKRWRPSPEVWVPVVYAVVSSAWVAFSDRLVTRTFGYGPRADVIETAKGVAYLLLTAGLIHLLLRTVLGRMRAARRRAERSEARAVQLLDSFQEGLFVMQDGRIVYANPAGGRLFGVPPEQLLGLTPADRTRLGYHAEKVVLDAGERPPY